MVGSWLYSVVSAAGSHFVTKTAEEAKTERKLELVKELAGLTPDQAAAVDAVKKQTVEEMEDRVTLGWGPFKELPPQASQQAREMRELVRAKMEEKFAAMTTEEKQALGAAVGQLTPEERQALLEAPDRDAAIKALVDAKVEKAMKARA